MMMVQFTLLRVNQDDDYTLHNIVEKTSSSFTFSYLPQTYSRIYFTNMVQNTETR